MKLPKNAFHAYAVITNNERCNKSYHALPLYLWAFMDRMDRRMQCDLRWGRKNTTVLLIIPPPSTFKSAKFGEVGFIIFSLLQNFGEGVFIIFSFPGSRIQWISPDFGSRFERFPLKESHFGGPKTPKNVACGDPGFYHFQKKSKRWVLLFSVCSEFWPGGFYYRGFNY